MTCQECQPLAIDLARGLPPFDVGGAVQRAEVLSHVAACKRCAQWLREQEALSEALRAVAEADAGIAAPPSVEANVMAAFRARQAQRPLVVGPAVVRPVVSQPVLVPASLLADRESVADTAKPERWGRTWRRPAAWRAGRAPGFAVAAAAIILVTGLAMASVRWLVPAGSSSNAGTHQGAGGSTAAHGTGTGNYAAIVEVLPDKGKKATKGRPAPPRVTVVASRATRSRGLDARRTTRATSVTRGANEFSGPAFVLLPYAEPLRPTEMRHIMRVRMPQTQLAAAGVPAGSAEDAVLADVLVGEDGMARAVRIVQ